MARNFLLVLGIILLTACASYQPTKNVWKGTKSLWATYVSPPANVDYEDKGSLSSQGDMLARAMLGADKELVRLERVMQNADRPPTREWMEGLFSSFPWLSGLAGVKYDGTILGQQPPDSLKELDFNYLLHEDAKQKSRALRADVQPSPLGPEVMIAAPLYDGIDFLGIVVAYFDFRALMGFSENPQGIVVLTPTALLWPGKYDFAATPLAGVDWSKVVRESTQGTCSNSIGTFFYMVRYFANLPLIFAVPQNGDFPEGNGGIEQGFAFFAPQREKGTPPPVSEERLKKDVMAQTNFDMEESQETPLPEAEMAAEQQRSSPNDLQPGSRESVLLKKSSAPSRRVEERQLEGENVPVERVQRPRRRPAPVIEAPAEDLAEPTPTVIQRPSPFGPREETTQKQYTRPSPFGPGYIPGSASSSSADESETAVTSPDTGREDKAVSKPAPEVSSPESDNKVPAQEEAVQSAPVETAPPTLPGGRPSPFGPRN